MQDSVEMTFSAYKRVQALLNTAGITLADTDSLNYSWIPLMEFLASFLSGQNAKINNLTSRVTTLETTVSNLQAQLSQVLNQDPINAPGATGPATPGVQAGWKQHTDPGGATYWTPIYK